jgi:mRNA interferase MazF
MTRGTVYWVNLEDTSPPEFGKIRPGVLVSNSEQNSILTTVAIIPISTRPPEIWPLRLKLPPMPGLKTGFAVIPGIRQVSKKRLLDEIGLLPDESLAGIGKALSAYLGE